MSPRIPVLTLAILGLRALSAGAQDAGEVLWSVDLPFQVVNAAPSVAPDGTIYIHSTDLIALSPAGEVLWTQPLGGGSQAVGIGADGTVYAGFDHTVFAFDPQGNLLWTFTEPPGGQGLMAGPGVGPDGNVYAITDGGGLGVISLTPDGKLRWNTPGFFNFAGTGNTAVEFGPDVLYFAEDIVPGCDKFAQGLAAVELEGGDVRWCESFSDVARPVGAPNGNSYHHATSSVLYAFEPDGDLAWSFPFPIPNQGLIGPAAAPDSAAFLFEDFFTLWAFEPDGTPRWTVPDAGGDDNFPIRPTVAPDNAALVFGTGVSFGQNGAVWAFDPADGSALWSLSLTGDSEGAAGPAAFSPDGQVVYVPISTSGEKRLIAIQVHDAAGALAVGPPEPGVAGVVNCFEVTGATPKGRVVLFVGRQAGSTTVPGCATPLDVEDARRRDTAFAGDAGEATLCALIPAGAAGRTLLAQALDRSAPGCAVSNVDETTY